MATAERSVPQHITDPDQVPGIEMQTLPDVKIFSHSPLLYWWPVWAVGYLLALLTWMQGETHAIGGVDLWIHPSKNLGVIYTMVFMMVILFTNVTMRGWISVTAIMSVMFVTVLFAYLGWWDEILSLVPLLSIHMNMGFYVFFSTFMLIIWLLAFFVFDRLEFYRVRPGLMTREFVVGGAETSYDTRGMMVEQLNMDFFRNYLLGLGAGDMRIITSGARTTELVLHNVLFVNRRVRSIQKLVAVKPDALVPNEE